MADEAKAWHYGSGEWSEVPDLVTNSWRDDELDEGAVLGRLGFFKIHTLGEPGEGLSLTLWDRHEGDPRHLICLEGDQFNRYLYAATLPDAWDVMARWSPMVRDDAITRLIAGATDPERGGAGLIETVACRAAWAARQQYEQPARRRQ